MSDNDGIVPSCPSCGAEGEVRVIYQAHREWCERMGACTRAAREAEIERLRDEVIGAQCEIERLRAALEKLASGHHKEGSPWFGIDIEWEHMVDIAREALKEGRDE